MTDTAAPGSGGEATRLAHNLVRRLNVGDTLTRSAARTPGALAVVDGERRLTYAELNAAVNRFAGGLRARGLGRGDSLALMSGNSAEFLITYYACAKLGVVCVPVNLSWRAAETEYVLRHAAVRALVVEAQLLDAARAALAGAPEIGVLVVAPGTQPEVAAIPSAGWEAFADILAAGTDAEPEAVVEDRDPVSYLYTSGTTAAPKGVVGSHLAITVSSMSAAIDMGLTAGERMGAMMPLFHTAQLNAFVTPVLLVGGTVHLLRGFDAAALLELIEAERLTLIFGLPMMYRELLDHPDVARRDLGSLRLAFYAMAPMPDAEVRRALDILGCDLALLFGQTEMSPITTIFRPEHQLSHTGAVGTPALCTQVAIMDADGTLLPQGETGEIVYRGPNALEGYLHDEEATATALTHGWFHSGDLGRFDGDGVLWFADRRKDVIKTGGENVASIEVERALYAAAPGIGEVVVIGLPHPRWTEAITAIVVPRAGAELTEAQVIAAAKERLAPFKVPKAVVLRDALPRTSTGKVQKHVLREEHAALYDV